MKRVPLYSRSHRPTPIEEQPAAAAAAVAGAAEPGRPARSRRVAFLLRHERRLWALLIIALAAAFWWSSPTLRVKPPLTMEQIDAGIRQSIEEKPLVSPVSRAYEAVLPSVVRVVGLMTEGDDGSDKQDGARKAPSSAASAPASSSSTTARSSTNLHVVSGAKKIRVTFMDGSESDAVIVGTQPENDLAVLRASPVPDDLFAATMRSTGDLAPGDNVLVVGFPFGIGPSATAGVVSGLKRQFRSPEGQQTLTNLIQFDAAANPGNSGGPLVTMDGEVVGIVTAILNPNRQRVFIGIGFAVPIENAAAAAGMPPF